MPAVHIVNNELITYTYNNKIIMVFSFSSTVENSSDGLGCVDSYQPSSHVAWFHQTPPRYELGSFTEVSHEFPAGASSDTQSEWGTCV